MKSIRITPELLFAIFTDGNEIHLKVENGIPEDAEFVMFGVERDVVTLFYIEKDEDRPWCEAHAVSLSTLPCSTTLEEVDSQLRRGRIRG